MRIIGYMNSLLVHLTQHIRTIIPFLLFCMPFYVQYSFFFTLLPPNILGTQQRTRSYMSDQCKVYKNMEYHQSLICNMQKCREYFATIGPWGACHKLVEPMKCSPYGPFTTLGIQNRNVSCHTLDGTHVANEYCETSENENIDTAVKLHFIFYFYFLLVYIIMHRVRVFEWSIK